MEIFLGLVSLRGFEKGIVAIGYEEEAIEAYLKEQGLKGLFGGIKRKDLLNCLLGRESMGMDIRGPFTPIFAGKLTWCRY